MYFYANQYTATSFNKCMRYALLLEHFQNNRTDIENSFTIAAEIIIPIYSNQADITAS